jgi:hypothetical protein
MSLLTKNQNYKMKGEHPMVRIDVRFAKILIPAAMFALAVFAGFGLSFAGETDMSTAVFFVG